MVIEITRKKCFNKVLPAVSEEALSSEGRNQSMGNSGGGCGGEGCDWVNAGQACGNIEDFFFYSNSKTKY